MLKRHLFRNYRAMSGVQFRLKRRVTPAGALVFWGAVCAAGLGMDTDVTMAYQGFAFLFCLLVVSGAAASLSRGQYVCRRVLPRFGTVGTPLPYRVVIKNLTRRPQRDLVLLDDLADPRPSFQEFATTPEPGEEKRNWYDRTFVYYRWQWLIQRKTKAELTELRLPTVPPRGEIEAEHHLLPIRRGRLDFTGMTIAWPDPFGLFRSLFRIPSPQTILILPKRYPLPPLTLPGTTQYQQGGVTLASSVGESEEFASLRDYRPGDPMRHIHWRSWAKSGKPVVKEFQDEFFVRHALILDTFSIVAESDMFEEAVSVAASLACTLQHQDSLLDLMFIGPQAFCFTAGRGVGHTEQILEILASVSICRDKPFSSLQRLVLEKMAAVSGCFCIFLAWDEERQNLVSQLKAMDIPVVVMVVTPAGSQTELRPGPLADQPDQLHALEVGKIAEGLSRL